VARGGWYDGVTGCVGSPPHGASTEIINYGLDSPGAGDEDETVYDEEAIHGMPAGKNWGCAMTHIDGRPGRR